MMSAQPEQPEVQPLALSRFFLKLGISVFGGPLAHIAVMDEETVNKRKWLTRAEFSNLLAASNLIPGPSSTELAIHIGYRRAGAWGAVIAGFSFILPAFLIMLGLGWLYTQVGNIHLLLGFFYGIKPAVVAVIALTVYRLAQSTLKDGLTRACAVAALLLSLWQPAASVYWMLLLGLVGLLVEAGRAGERPTALLAILFVPLAQAGGQHPVLLGSLFLALLKVGATLFGSGLVVVPLLQAELVNNNGWLTQQTLLDGVALAQATPGPVLTIATFVGYQIAGLAGAVVATVAIFLPAFIVVLLTAPLIERLKHNRWLKAFLGPVSAAVVGTLTASTLLLAQPVLLDPFAQPFFVDWLALVITLTAFALALRFKLNSAWIIIGAGLLGLLIKAA